MRPTDTKSELLQEQQYLDRLYQPREFTIELMAATKRHIMQKVPL
jgi:hypothetical protein